MKYKNLMAKALYDNVPETPEELAFRKGDILTVIEQNTGGLEGWWLCSLHGRQGIAPGNRLKLLIGPMFDSQSPQQRPHTPQGPHQGPPAPQSAQPEGPYQLPPAHDVYQVPQPQRGPPGADAPHSKVVTPIRVGQSYSYSPSQNASQDLYDVPPVRPQGVYDIPPGRPLGYHGSSGAQGVYDTPPLGHADPRMQGVYDTPLPRKGMGRFHQYHGPTASSVQLGSTLGHQNNHVSGVSEEGNYDFPQPLRVRPEGIYDVPPPSLARAAQCPQPTYDYPASSETPPRPAPSGPGEGIYDVPVSQSAAGGGSLYDIPRGTQQPHRDRSKGVYDVPPLDASRSPAEVTERVNRLSFSSTGSSMSTSSSSSSSSVSSPADVRLALDLDSAVQTLGRLLQNLEASVLALRSLTASSRWRTHAYVEHHGNEVRAGLEQVRAALADFVVFGRGALALAALVDPVLHAKLRRQLQRLDDSQQILQQTHHALDASGWALGATATTGRHGDELERFIMVARTVPDDAKQLASTVGGSAELLFRRAPVEGVTHPFPPPAPEDEGVGGPTKPFPVPQEKTSVDNGEKCVKSWMEDYDYVHLQGKEEFERQQKELLEKENLTKQSRDTLEHEQLKQLKQLEQEVIKPVENDITQWISHQNSTGSTSSPSGSTSSPSDSTSSSTSSSVGGGAQLCGRDRQLLAFYAEQCERHFVTLLNAVDAFFSCVAAGQPPRVFVAHGKFVILSAHKLVFIGDTLSRQAATPDLASRMIHYSDALCHMLKTVVGATKMAALRYPSTGAVQEMVDRVTDLSHHAQQFKAQLCHMAGPGCH